MGFFTSGLSVNEFALLNRLGPQPLAQVMGASVIQTGWQYLPALDPGIVNASAYAGRASAYGPSPSGYAFQNRYTDASMAQVRNYRWHAQVVCTLDVMTDAWNSARRSALERLREEASAVGADAVVGVHLHRGERDLGKGTIDYVVGGTAIRLPGSTGADRPALSNVPIQDYWRLKSAGQDPVAFVASTVVVFASPSRATRLRRLRTKAQNQELEELSQAFLKARAAVRSNLRDQVAASGATGVVGVELTHSVHHEALALASAIQSSERRGWHVGRFGVPYRVSGKGDAKRTGWVITMHAAGSAVRRRGGRIGPATKTTIGMSGR